MLHKCNPLSLEHLVIKPLLKIGWPWMAPGHFPCLLLCQESWILIAQGQPLGAFLCRHLEEASKLPSARINQSPEPGLD